MKKNSNMKLTAGLIFILLGLGPALPAYFPQAATDQTEQNLKQEIVKLKYISASSVSTLLRSYWTRYTRISSDPKVGDIVILSDTPENLGKMLAAIKEIDVKPKDLVFTIQVIMASDSEDRTDPELKGDPLIKELQKLLRYKSYQLLDATMVRAIDRRNSLTTFGPNNQFDISIRPEVSEGQPQGNIKMEVGLRQIKVEQVVPSEVGRNFWSKIDPVYLINSHLNLKSGDRAVVGVSRLTEGDASGGSNKGLILIISGKILY